MFIVAYITLLEEVAGPRGLKDLFSSMKYQESVTFLLEYLGFKYMTVLLVTTSCFFCGEQIYLEKQNHWKTVFEFL